MRPLLYFLLAGLLISCTDFEAQEKLAAKNRQQGAAFLAANHDKAGVQVRPSGLQFMVLREGSGAKPAATDSVTVHYRGTLIDGAEFDSSYARGEPAQFSLGGVIPGWREGLQLMRVGGHYRFFIPSGLGYGDEGAGEKIGPDATLIFDVELLAVNGML